MRQIQTDVCTALKLANLRPLFIHSTLSLREKGQGRFEWKTYITVFTHLHVKLKTHKCFPATVGSLEKEALFQVALTSWWKIAVDMILLCFSFSNMLRNLRGSNLPQEMNLFQRDVNAYYEQNILLASCPSLALLYCSGN